LIPARDSISGPTAVIHARSDRIIDFDKHLEILGFPSSQCIEARENLIVPSLVVSPWAAPPAQITPANYQLIFDLYTGRIDKCERRRLYLSRNHVRPGNRSVLNQDQILEKLTPLGFEVLYGSEPLDQIITKFAQAEFVTGAHGSLFANTMFCQNDARIVEFCPKDRPDFSFKRKFKKAEYYIHHLVECDEEYNIEIDVDEILRHLDG
jgi:capsular polysaccharide biosynthesis protein